MSWLGVSAVMHQGVAGETAPAAVPAALTALFLSQYPTEYGMIPTVLIHFPPVGGFATFSRL